MDELHLPVSSDSGNPVEMARIWITTEDGRSHMSLNYGVFGARELETWGSLAADLLAHLVNAHLMNGGESTAEEAFAMIEKGLYRRLQDDPILAGKFSNRVLS